jgi:hypothetical protein
VNPTERQALKGIFVATALYFGQELPDAALKLYCEDLEDLPFTQVAEALKALRRDPKTTRCPLPSAIRAKLNPESNAESEAIVLASRIVGQITRLGPYQPAAARMALGPVAWEVVQMEGGWESICQTLTFENMPILKAQWRNLAKALIERGGHTPSVDRPAIPDKRSTTGLTNLSDIFKGLPKPEGQA